MSLLLCGSAPSFDSHGQACGYSINTIYVKDGEGKPVRNVHLAVRRKDPNDDYNAHFAEASKVYSSDERNAHVYQHGLCGSHRDLILTVSADGFEKLESPVDLLLGRQAFEITLKSKGSGGSGTFKVLSCREATTLCVKAVIH